MLKLRIKQQLLLDGLEDERKAIVKQWLAEGTHVFPVTKHLAYNSYNSMMERCFSPIASGWKDYGGRGITVCKQWRENFLNFLIDMGPRPPDYIIERKDVNGNYEPSNCVWQPKSHATRNTRKTTVPWFDGETSKEHEKRRRKLYRARRRTPWRMERHNEYQRIAYDRKKMIILSMLVLAIKHRRKQAALNDPH